MENKNHLRASPKVGKMLLLVACFILLSLGFLSLFSYLPQVRIQRNVQIEGKYTVGLIADTHVPGRASEIPEKVFEIFKTAKIDYIIHAGDISSQKVINKLEKIAPVTAVRGNHEEEEVRSQYPSFASLEVHGTNIGVTHLSQFFFRRKHAVNIAKRKDFDVLIVGHSHRQEKFKNEDVLIINPGSPTFTFPYLVNKTVALLTLNKRRNVQFIEV